jgi:hypothetical protein
MRFFGRMATTVIQALDVASIYDVPPYDGYNADSVVTYDDGCGWLYRKARRTGKAYWWRRYERCVGYDGDRSGSHR